ncbi:hypothetical protein UlMin_032451 [Ulmus minor]
MTNDNTAKNELKRDLECVKVAKSNESLNKKQAKEVSNEDIRSEVTNPVTSPKKQTSTFQDMTSQPAVLANGNQVECGEFTSTWSGDSSSEETSSDADERDDSLMSRIVLEIPEQAGLSGILKITFKFSKRKGEDYETGPSALAVEPAIDGFDRVSSYIGSYAEPWRFDLCDRNLESKMSKKLQSSYPANVKKLLATCILDGAQVKYVSVSSKNQLQGIISDGGYSCGCSLCNFSRFELHAGVKTRHPNNHIYLENGRPIYSIIQEPKTAPLNQLNEVMDMASTLQQGNTMTEVDKWHCNPSRLSHPPVGYTGPASEESDSPTSNSFSHNDFKFVLRVCFIINTRTLKKSVVQHKKKAEGGTKRSLPFPLVQMDNDIHRLLFMPKTLPDGVELAYYVKGQPTCGYKQGHGIVCNCCDSEVEAHDGMPARRQPYRHIYTSIGLTLHDIAISLASGQNLTTGDSDDMCVVRGDGELETYEFFYELVVFNGICLLCILGRHFSRSFSQIMFNGRFVSFCTLIHLLEFVHYYYYFLFMNIIVQVDDVKKLHHSIIMSKYSCCTNCIIPAYTNKQDNQSSMANNYNLQSLKKIYCCPLLENSSTRYFWGFLVFQTFEPIVCWSFCVLLSRGYLPKYQTSRSRQDRPQLGRTLQDHKGRYYHDPCSTRCPTQQVNNLSVLLSQALHLGWGNKMGYIMNCSIESFLSHFRTCNRIEKNFLLGLGSPHLVEF